MKPNLILTLPAHPVPYAVLGQPIHHSLSPLLQQAAFDHLGVEAHYFRIEVDDLALAKAVHHLRQVPFGGWNCTVPNKVKMYELCEQRSESAEQFRAVNTVVVEKDQLVGHNTDGIGWSRALQDAFGRGAADLRLLLLGAGGAGRAIATQAVLEKCPLILIANRDPVRARELHTHLLAQFAKTPWRRTEENLQVVRWWESELEKAIAISDLIVNATSAGFDPLAQPILPSRLIPNSLLVFDTVYGAASQALQREVALAGATWSDGLGMLLHQGAAAFSLWTGQPAPLEVMRKALAAAFSASLGQNLQA